MKFEVICWNLLHSLQMIKGQVCRFGGIQRWESTLLTVVFSRPTLCYLSFFHNCFGLLWARYGGTAFYVNKTGHYYQIKIWHLFGFRDFIQERTCMHMFVPFHIIRTLWNFTPGFESCFILFVQPPVPVSNFISILPYDCRKSIFWC